MINFTQFEQKNTHTSLCIIVHLCTIATVTVHICTTTVACAFYILIVFHSLLFFSFFFIRKTNSPSHVLFSSDTTHSHRHNQKSTTKIKNQPQNQPKKNSTTKSTKKINHWNKIVGSVVLMEIGDGLMLIGFDGDR